MTENRPLSEKPLGYLLAAGGGILGGPFGIIASPLVLFLLNKIMLPSADKSPNRFKTWALAGIVGAPVCIALALPFQPDTPSASSGQGEESVVQSQPTEDSTGVTMKNYMKIENGMSYSEVVQILGVQGTEISSSDVAGYSTVMYKWNGKGSFGANMNATFQNGSLVSKAQFGLE